MKLILATTRYLIGLATSLHLVGLNQTVKNARRAALKVSRQSDVAQIILDRARQATETARQNKAEARSAERTAYATMNATVAAATAEASSLRREHNVGA